MQAEQAVPRQEDDGLEMASVEDLGLEVIEVEPQITLTRPIRHIRSPQ